MKLLIYWICRSIIFKLWLKSRDLYSSSQVPGSPCDQELAKVGPESLRLMETWAQGQLGTGQPIRGLGWVTLAKEKPELACGQLMPDTANSPAAAGGQPEWPHWPRVTSC